MGTEVIRRKEGISLYQQMYSLKEFEFANLKRCNWNGLYT